MTWVSVERCGSGTLTESRTRAEAVEQACGWRRGEGRGNKPALGKTEGALCESDDDLTWMNQAKVPDMY